MVATLMEVTVMMSVNDNFDGDKDDCDDDNYN